MSNDTLNFFDGVVDANASFVDCGNATVDPDTGSCPIEPTGSDVIAISNMTCGKQVLMSSISGFSWDGYPYLII